MTPQSSVFAVAGFAIAILIGQVLTRVMPALPSGNRSYSIDGLRGYLAFGVVLHHGYIWYFFLHTNRWEPPFSRLYAHLGNSSVIMFFMITAFLFSGKLLNERGTYVAWRKLYIGRVFRLFPLYLPMFVALLVLVAIATGFQSNVVPRALVSATLTWAALAVFGQPPINGLQETGLIVASVPWTLRYEVLFYALLPTIGLVVGCRPAWPWIAFGLVVSAFILVFTVATDGVPPFALTGAFAVGTVAAYATRLPPVIRLATRKDAGAAVILLIVAGVASSHTGMQLRSVFLFGCAFILIAAGNDLFGVLRTRASRYLGEISYGIYLFHGIVLYVAFTYVVGIPTSQSMGPTKHWAVVLACAPIVLIFAAMAHLAIEKPGIAMGGLLAKSRRWPAMHSGAVRSVAP